MTRQQRRKMERDSKKGRNVNQNYKPTVYSSSIVHWESLNKTGMVIGSFISSENISKIYKNDSVYESIYLVDVENNGVTTPSHIRIIHNSEKCRYDNELSNNLLIDEVFSLILSSKNRTQETLNVNTKFTTVVCKSSELDSKVLYQLEEYWNSSVENDKKLLSDLFQIFKKVG